MDIADKLPTVLSLCSGYGGLERGLDLAGVEHRVLAYVEIEAYAIALMAKKMANGVIPPAPIYTNLKTLPVEPFRGRVDILTAGYPCQPFSAAGKRAGKEDPRHLWPYIVDIIRAVRPVRCFFENVEGHISLGLREVISDLEGLGYSTAWGIFSAAEVSVCEQYPKGVHQRKRVFIMADSNGARQQSSKRSIQEPKFRNNFGGSSKKLADSNDGQCELAEQEIQARGNAAGNGSADLGNAASIRCNGWATFTKREGSANIQEQSKSNLRGEFERSDQILAHTNSPRSEIGISGSERPNQKGNAGITDDRCGEQGGWQIGMHWPSEPRLGRVVDGCADRVDRIRLLGNGVVPATAAKAWRVLNG